MDKRRRTEDLISRLASGPPPPRFWPTFPFTAGLLGVIYGMTVVLIIGIQPVTFEVLLGPGFSMTLLSATVLLIGIWLGLLLASPAAHINVVTKGIGFTASLITVAAILRAPMPGLGQFIECFFVVQFMALPALFVTLRLLARGATLHPSVLGGAAGLFAGGLANIIFLLHCPDLLTGAGLHAQLSALLVLVILGALLGPKFLRW